MIDGYIRPLLPKLVQPLIRFYISRGWTPNLVTTIGFAFALAAASAVAFGFFKTALVLWWLSRLIDGTDGILARETKMTSDLGAYLDIVADMAAYCAMIVGFYIWRTDLAWLWILILYLYVLCITSALSLGSLEQRLGLNKSDNRGLRLSAGLAEAGETGLCYSAFLLMPEWLLQLGLIWLIILIYTVAARTYLASVILKGRRY